MADLTLPEGKLANVVIKPKTAADKDGVIKGPPTIAGWDPLIVDLAIAADKMSFKVAWLEGGSTTVDVTVRPVDGPDDGSEDVSGTLNVTALPGKVVRVEFEIGPLEDIPSA